MGRTAHACYALVVSDGPTLTLHGRRRPVSGGELGLELVSVFGDDEPCVLPTGTTTLGRGDDVDIKLDGEGVSRKHAKLVHRGGDEVQLIDLGSHNGTLIDDVKVEVALLRPGDDFKLGSVVLRLVALRPASARAQPPPGADQLSPRELEVARLVAQGMTNSEAGKTLHISPRTVGRHLGNIYERLGIHSRAALAKLIGELDARG